MPQARLHSSWFDDRVPFGQGQLGYADCVD